MYIVQKKQTILTKLLVFTLCICLLCTGCAADNTNSSEASSYTSIAMEEAVSRMESETGYVLLDVRTEQEYAGGHIPGAVCIPNETIEEDVLECLPDMEQLIFVYCRSGNRSKQASEKLVNLGYTNIVEIGGVKDWPGELVVVEKE